jgi:[acyl-carrier-protein] S-malonyltransferase
MQKAAEKMASILSHTEFAYPSCLQAPNASGQLSRDPIIIKNELIMQITASVHWVQTIENMLAQGVEVFIEAGPKNILSGMVKKIVAEGKAEIYNVEDTDSLRVTLQALGL